MRAYLGRHHVALLALFVALGGTSYAATKLPANSVGSKQLKKNAVIPSKVAPSTRALFRGKTGARGARGPTGAIGPTGPQGAPAASAVIGFLGPTGDLLDYVNPTGLAGGDITESGVAIAVSPDATMVARDLYVSTSGAPGGVESRAVTLRVNHADTALTCTMTGAATNCTSGSGTVSVPAGSVLSMKVQKSGGAPNAYVYWGFGLTTP